MDKTTGQYFKSRAVRFFFFAWVIAISVEPAIQIYTGFRWATNSTVVQWVSNMTITLPVLMFIVFVVALAVGVLNTLWNWFMNEKPKRRHSRNSDKAKELTEEIGMLGNIIEKKKLELKDIETVAEQITDKGDSNVKE